MVPSYRCHIFITDHLLQSPSRNTWQKETLHDGNHSKYKQPLARDMWCKNRTCVDLQQDSPGGGGGCGCGSVEEGELCELTCGTAAVEGGGGSKEWHREEGTPN